MCSQWAWAIYIYVELLKARAQGPRSDEIYMRIIKEQVTHFSFFLGFFLSAPAELERSRLALTSDLTELCDPERLLLLFLSFDLSRPLALALSISIASDAPGWFLSLWPAVGLGLPVLGLFKPSEGLSVGGLFILGILKCSPWAESVSICSKSLETPCVYDDVDDVEVVLFLAGLSELAVPYSVLAPSLPGSGLSQPASGPKCKVDQCVIKWCVLGAMKYPLSK